MVVITELQSESVEKIVENVEPVAEKTEEATTENNPNNEEMKSEHSEISDNSEEKLEDCEEKSGGSEEKLGAESSETAAKEWHKERYSIVEETRILHYMHEFTYDPETADMVEKFRGHSPNTSKFWQGFIDATGSKRHLNSLLNRWPKLLRKMHTLPIKTEMKLNLYYSLSIPIPEQFMETVRKEANFAVDKDRNLEAFEMKSPEQMEKELNKKKRRSSETIAGGVSEPRVKRAKKSFDETEDVGMWTFLLGKITDPLTQKVRKDQVKPKSVPVWKEYLGPEADAKTVRSCVGHYDTMAKHLYKMPFNTRMKVDLYYGLGIPVNPAFLEALQQKYEITSDENGCIVEYNSEQIQDN
uniref:SPK domain-containing protein n=1 Tax=Caenorhabditis tropicalis TaxID=1561998 RepID=A0A1I7T2P4_9PELO